jgi:hypothetical protein
VADQRMLGNVLVENPVAVRKIKCVVRIGDRRILPDFAIYFVVGGDLGTYELGYAGVMNRQIVARRLLAKELQRERRRPAIRQP